MTHSPTTGDDKDRVTLSVSFGLRGRDLDPDVVTNRLDLQPTHQHRRGEVRVGRDGTPRPRPWSVWQIRSDQSVIGSVEPARHLEWLLTLLEPRAERIRELRQTAEYADLRIWYETATGNVASFGLPSSLLARACVLIDEVNLSIITANDDTH